MADVGANDMGRNSKSPRWHAPTSVPVTFPPMFRPFFWVIRWILALALLGFAVAAMRVACAPLASASGWGALASSPILWIVVGGFALRWLLARLPGGDPLEFLDTLEHELTHAVVGTLTFAPPIALSATMRDGGEVELKRSNPAAALAPYCLPLFAGGLALLTLVLREEWSTYGRFAVAFLLGSFFWRLLREFHFGQSDFRAYGFVFSMFFIAGALPLCLLGVADIAQLADFSWAECWKIFVEQCRWVSGHAIGFASASPSPSDVP
jgi:hypothetical protein